jgi:hypothetical protein
MKMIHDETDLSEWRALFRKYFVIKKEIMAEIDEQQRDLLGNRKTLGVLCRGTDYVNVRPSAHPVQPSLPELMEKVDAVFRGRQCEIIYLATEDEDVYQSFKNRYQDKLIVSKAKRYRNTGADNINAVIKKENDSIFTQGKDYLVSIALLSRCECLVAGCTSGTYGALMMSGGYEFQYIFDLGLYE